MNTKHRTIKVGIMPLVDFKKRTIAIAQGKYKPQKNEPKVWFHSIKSLAHVLSEENQRLLKLIADINPQSIRDLETATGRKANNLLRTLRTMENYGFVELLKGNQGRGRAALIPKVIYDSVDINVSFG